MPELNEKSRRQCHYYLPTLLKGTRKTKLSVLLKLLSKHTRKCTALLRKKKKNVTVKYVFMAVPRRTLTKTARGKEKKKKNL